MTTFPNWFTGYASDCFDQHLTGLAGKPGLRFLQIGVFTGDASLWLLNNVLTGDGSTLVDVDTWRGSDEPEHEPLDFQAVEAFYDERTAAARMAGRLVKFKGSSRSFFAEAGAFFDFVYIDGGHDAVTVLGDAVDAYRVLKPDGLLAFDDYQWKSGKGSLHDPAMAIDTIVAIYRGGLRPIEVGRQVWLRKVA